MKFICVHWDKFYVASPSLIAPIAHNNISSLQMESTHNIVMNGKPNSASAMQELGKYRPDHTSWNHLWNTFSGE